MSDESTEFNNQILKGNIRIRELIDEENEIILPELTEEALEKLLADSCVSVFITDETKDIIRVKFRKKL